MERGNSDVMPAFKHPVAGQWLSNCFDQYLSKLPASLKIVVLLGNSERWIATISEQARRLYPDSYQPVSNVAYLAGGKLWVHIGHPSPGNGHFNKFVQGANDVGQGRKREQAATAVRQVLSLAR